MDIPILYQDRHITVLLKPPGMPSIEDRTGDASVLAHIANNLAGTANSLAENGIPDVKPVHRLDRPVGGIMVVAHSDAAAAGFGNPPALQKTYYSVACGKLQKKGALENMLFKDQRRNISYVKEGHPKAKKALLHYETVDIIENSAWGDLSLLKIQLVTGRHHQIRVQLAYANAPIWGDTKYNPVFQRGRFLLALFSGALSFRHPITGKKMAFSADLPKESPFSFFPLNQIFPE